MHLFTREINNWDDWDKLIQSVSAFAPLVAHIFQNEKLPMSKIENLTNGTNAIFRVGGYVIKILPPTETCNPSEGHGTDIDLELFGMRLAHERNVPAPKCIVDGEVNDKYHFRYIIMTYIHGKTLCDRVVVPPTCAVKFIIAVLK